MANLLDEQTTGQLNEIFKELEEPVKLLFFTQGLACPNCREQEQLLKEVEALSDKITLETYEFVRDGEEALKYSIDKIPATAVIGRRDYGIRFFGLTVGYEFSSLVEAIIMVSRGKSGLSPEIEQLAARIKEPVHLQVMVTLTCPYCPTTVHAAHQLALLNEHIRADMVEASEFPVVAQYYGVSGVPKTIINDSFSVEGALPAEGLLLEILKSVNPAEYKRLRDSVREMRGQRRRVTKPDPDHVYETIIVGGGPGAMSAALYAARKDLDVLMLGKDIGGQMNFTSTIDNYLGLPGVGGKEMTELFRNHVEQYTISENVGQDVTAITLKDGTFSISLDGGSVFKGKSVIYCAGKEYRRLGIPREEAFIGKGIAFCATCDAPLYRGKKVAVVGGGNSAFTAVRDLLNFASEIHLVHRRKDFTADAALVREVEAAENLTFHKGMLVREILGKEKLEGIRLISADGKERRDLLVDGVFLEIGLTPNTAPVKELLKLNEKSEIPVDIRNATELPGFFAAGDATDVFEKQICIAVGDGAKAALSAHSYLLEHKLTKSKVTVGDTWE